MRDRFCKNDGFCWYFLFEGSFTAESLELQEYLQGYGGEPHLSVHHVKNRFTFLNSEFSLDDPETRATRWKQDRFAAAREIFEEFNYNCSRALQAVDENLYELKNQVLFVKTPT